MNSRVNNALNGPRDIIDVSEKSKILQDFRKNIRPGLDEITAESRKNLKKIITVLKGQTTRAVNNFLRPVIKRENESIEEEITHKLNDIQERAIHQNPQNFPRFILHEMGGILENLQGNFTHKHTVQSYNILQSLFNNSKKIINFGDIGKYKNLSLVRGVDKTEFFGYEKDTHTYVFKANGKEYAFSMNVDMSIGK